MLLNSKQDGLGNSALYIKMMLTHLVNKPQVLAVISQTLPEDSLKVLKDTLSSCFYEDLIAENRLNENKIKLFSRLIEV